MRKSTALPHQMIRLKILLCQNSDTPHKYWAVVCHDHNYRSITWLWWVSVAVFLTAPPRMTSSRTVETTPERAGREREKLVPAPKTPPGAEKEEPTNHAPGPQKLPRAKKKRKLSRQSRSTDDDLPLPALCHLETVKKIQIKAADLEQQSIIHDRFTVGMMRLNILKIINYNSQQEETINGRLYVHSPSPLTELICLMKNSEMSMANHELQKVFLEDFHQRPGHAAISDVFLM